MRPPEITVTTIGLGAALLALVAAPPPARAAFVGTDGTDPDALRRRRVAVAVVEVVAEHVDAARKQRGFVLYRHVDLKILHHVYGPRPGPAGLAKVPYTPWVNSAWPVVRGSLVGRRFLMGWVHGQACGLGLTVSFGPRLQLPILVSGPKDPWVAAVAAFLALPRGVAPGQDRAMLERAFGQAAHPRLALIADQGLGRLDPSHRQSPRRFLGLLALLDPYASVEDRLGWTILADLRKLPAPKTEAAYRRWWAGVGGPPPGLGYDAFRARVATRLAAIAVDPKAEKELRRNALMALARPAIYVATRRDAVNAAAEAAILRATRDPQVEVRRSALVALLDVARALSPVIPSQGRRLRQAVRDGLRRERDPAERAILRRQLGR